MRHPILACLAALAVSAAAAPPRPDDVLAALNDARQYPADYALTLERYRAFYHGTTVLLPGDPVRHLTKEGVVPLDEARTYVARQPQLEPLLPSPVLAAAAAEHVADQGRTGATGHIGANGSRPGDRVLRHGGGFYIGEVIGYGTLDAADAIRQLIIDDGVPSRGHRTLLFDPSMRYAGAACGPHPVYHIMCVIDLAPTPGGLPPSGDADPAAGMPLQPPR